jgi:hypothetical protein
MKMPTKVIVTSFVLACLVCAVHDLPSSVAQAQSLESWNQPCRKLLKEYKTKPGHKAFAVSYLSSGSGGGQSCGAAWGAGTKQQAEAQAIKSCAGNVAGKCGINRSE